ncbi:formyl transferase, partial [Thermococci archaeon]
MPSPPIYIMIGWFSTGRDKAARDLLEYIVKKGIDISFVFCNREKGESEESDRFTNLVESYGFDLICFSSRKFLPELRKKDKKKWRTLYDTEILDLIPHVKLNILAGYMLILSPIACDTL